MLRRHGNAIAKREQTAGGRPAAAGRTKTCTNVAVLIDTNILVCGRFSRRL